MQHILSNYFRRVHECDQRTDYATVTWVAIAGAADAVQMLPYHGCV